VTQTSTTTATTETQTDTTVTVTETTTTIDGLEECEKYPVGGFLASDCEIIRVEGAGFASSNGVYVRSDDYANLPYPENVITDFGYFCIDNNCSISAFVMYPDNFADGKFGWGWGIQTDGHHRYYNEESCVFINPFTNVRRVEPGFDKSEEGTEPIPIFTCIEMVATTTTTTTTATETSTTTVTETSITTATETTTTPEYFWVGDGGCRVDGVNVPSLHAGMFDPVGSLVECLERCNANPDCDGAVEFFSTGPKAGRCQLQREFPTSSSGNPGKSGVACYALVSEFEFATEEPKEQFTGERTEEPVDESP
jgi:hypothetical protein